MNAYVRSSISCAVAVATVSALISAPAPPQDSPAVGTQRAIVLTAQVQPSATPTALAPQPLTLAAEQVNFHVGLFVDFIVTGAQLVGRQVAIPGTLLRDIETGTPIPVALSRAVQTFVEIELDAGRELVGFAAQYVDFQVRFIASVLQAAVAVATAIPVAVAELATSTVSHFMPAPAIGPGEAPSVRAAQQEAAVSATTTTENDAFTDSKAASSLRSIESTSDSDDETKVSAQGEIRSSASTDTADADATEPTADDGDATRPLDTGLAEEEAAAEDVSQADDQERDGNVKSKGDQGADDAAQGNAGE